LNADEDARRVATRTTPCRAEHTATEVVTDTAAALARGTDRGPCNTTAAASTTKTSTATAAIQAAGAIDTAVQVVEAANESSSQTDSRRSS
jgi:hypothetical protein